MSFIVDAVKDMLPQKQKKKEESLSDFTEKERKILLDNLRKEKEILAKQMEELESMDNKKEKEIPTVKVVKAGQQASVKEPDKIPVPKWQHNNKSADMPEPEQTNDAEDDGDDGNSGDEQEVEVKIEDLIAETYRQVVELRKDVNALIGFHLRGR